MDRKWIEKISKSCLVKILKKNGMRHWTRKKGKHRDKSDESRWNIERPCRRWRDNLAADYISKYVPKIQALTHIEDRTGKRLKLFLYQMVDHFNALKLV